MQVDGQSHVPRYSLYCNRQNFFGNQCFGSCPTIPMPNTQCNAGSITTFVPRSVPPSYGSEPCPPPGSPGLFPQKVTRSVAAVVPY
jgi:hypothetical protein